EVPGVGPSDVRTSAVRTMGRAGKDKLGELHVSTLGLWEDKYASAESWRDVKKKRNHTRLRARRMFQASPLLAMTWPGREQSALSASALPKYHAARTWGTRPIAESSRL